MEGKDIVGGRVKKFVVWLCELLLFVGCEGKGKFLKFKRFCFFEVFYCCVLGLDLFWGIVGLVVLKFLKFIFLNMFFFCFVKFLKLFLRIEVCWVGKDGFFWVDIGVLSLLFFKLDVDLVILD